MRIEYHRTLIADAVRNAAFERALAAVIKPGETTVADIGAGTGLIALMAARLGAREVFLYEAAEVAGVAAKILKANRVRNCHLFPCHSTEMEDPPKVDVVVSETLGNYPFEEHIIETLNDARARFLKPKGTHHPAPLDAARRPRRVRPHPSRAFAPGTRAGFDLARGQGHEPQQHLRARARSPRSCSTAARARASWDAIDFGRENRTSRKGEAGWRLKAPATIYGFATWWRAELAPGVMLSTAPGDAATHWEQLYFPLLTPLAVEGRRDGRNRAALAHVDRGRHARRLDGEAPRRKRA